MNIKYLYKMFFLGLFAIFTCNQTIAASNSYLADGMVTSKIKAKIAVDKSLSMFNVSVTTNNGIVTLDGVIDSDTDAQNLLQLVQNTNGVTGINIYKLKVKRSTYPLKDILVTTKVKTNLISQHVFKDESVPLSGVNVETKNGIVYLSGNVQSTKEVNRAIDVARGTSGVKRVVSKLKVAG